MPQTKSTSNTTGEYNDYRTDMVGILHSLFKRKGLIAGGIISITLLALILSFTLPKVYRSEGFFQFSDPTMETNNPLFSTAAQMLDSSKLVLLSQLQDLGMLSVLKELNIELVEEENFHVITLQKFKKYSSAFSNYQEFFAFVKRNKILDASEQADLRNRIRNSGQFAKLTREIYALSRDDLKNVGQTLLKEKNYIVGVQLEMEAAQNEQARRYLSALGQFIRFSIFKEKLSEYAAMGLDESTVQVSRYDNYALNNQSALEQLQQKKEKLTQLYKKFPAFSNFDSRQLVELGDNGQQYLSLAAQLVGVESRIIDLERILESFAVERTKSLLYSKFFTELKDKLDKNPGSGDLVFKTFENLKEDFFNSNNPQAPITQSVHNAVEIDLNRFKTLFQKTLQFVSGPTLPSVPEWPRKSIFLIFGFFLGFIIFVSVALILEFWEKYKTIIRTK